MKNKHSAPVLSACLLGIQLVLSPAVGAAEAGHAYPSSERTPGAGEPFWTIPPVSRQWDRPARTQHWTIPSVSQRWNNPQEPLRWTIPRTADDMR